MKNIIITPKLLKEYGACKEGKTWAVSVIGKGMPLSKMLPLFDRADWMIWLLRKTVAADKTIFFRLAIACAESVLYIFKKKYPNDKRPRKAIEAAIEYV